MEGSSWREDKEDSGDSRGLKGEEFCLSSDLQKRIICQVYLDDWHGWSDSTGLCVCVCALVGLQYMVFLCSQCCSCDLVCSPCHTVEYKLTVIAMFVMIFLVCMQFTFSLCGCCTVSVFVLQTALLGPGPQARIQHGGPRWNQRHRALQTGKWSYCS